MTNQHKLETLQIRATEYDNHNIYLVSSCGCAHVQLPANAKKNHPSLPRSHHVPLTCPPLENSPCSPWHPYIRPKTGPQVKYVHDTTPSTSVCRVFYQVRCPAQNCLFVERNCLYGVRINNRIIRVLVPVPVFFRARQILQASRDLQGYPLESFAMNRSGQSRTSYSSHLLSFFHWKMTFY